jgi:hypothetical protein
MEEKRKEKKKTETEKAKEEKCHPKLKRGLIPVIRLR